MSSVVESSFGTKKDGNTNPIAAPKGADAVAIVVAIALPLAEYQVADTLAGTFIKKGYPIPAMI